MDYKKLKTLLWTLVLFLVTGTALQAQDVTVEGTVTNAQTNEPIENVNIVVRGTTLGAATDGDGHYNLQVSSLQDTLVFSFIGYQSEVVYVDGRTTIDIELKPTTIMGEQLVVTAFGEKREQLSVVGAVQSIISPTRTLSVGTASLTNAFAGRLAGVIAFQRSGQPGANASQFFIRGISTFSGSTQPLIIIDGVRASAADLNALSPEIIKSFSILKDATATAVYGSEAANGVMIVTTKTGRNLESPRIHIRMESSVNTPTEVPQFAGGVTFMKLYNQAIRLRDSGQIPYSQNKIRGTKLGLNPYVYPNVDWYNRLFKEYGLSHSVNLNVMGGSDNITYFLSATYDRGTGMLEKFDLYSYDTNIVFKRYAFQANVGADITPSTHVSLNLNTTLEDYHSPAYTTDHIFGMVMNANPVDFPVMFPQSTSEKYSGNVLFGGKGGGRYNSGYRNPLAEMVNGYQDEFTSTVRANFQLQQDLDFFLEGLAFHAVASFKNWSATTVERIKGYNSYQISNYNRFSPDSVSFILDRVGEQQDLTLSTGTGVNGDRSIFFQARFNYETMLAEKHEVSAMVGYHQRSYNLNVPGGLIGSLPQRNRGAAGRFTYTYDNTYIGQFTFGYNGTSAFAEGHRFGFFPAVGVGLVVSNMEVWEPIKNVVNFFKIRASYGLVGNDDIGSARYAYLSSISLGGYGYRTGRDMDYYRSGFRLYRAANRGLQWEVGRKLNIGLNLTLFSSLDITANVYREKRSGIFLQRQTLPASFGLHGVDIYGNLGDVTNKGLEFQINYSHAFSSDLFMSFKGTFTYAHNVVTDKAEPLFLQFPHLSAVGYSIGSWLALKAQRLFIDKADIRNSPDQQLGGRTQPGDIKYKDITGDGIINSNDRIHMGYPYIPEIQFGFGPSVQYKNWDFSFLIQGTLHRSIMMSGFAPFGSSNIRGVMQFIADSHWSRKNEDIYAAYPRLSINDNANNTVDSSWWLRNGAYVKLKYAELGYNFIFGDDAEGRVYISARNIFEISPFDLWDPELTNIYGYSNGLSYPLQRTLNVGLQITF